MNGTSGPGNSTGQRCSWAGVAKAPKATAKPNHSELARGCECNVTLRRSPLRFAPVLMLAQFIQLREEGRGESKNKTCPAGMSVRDRLVVVRYQAISAISWTAITAPALP